MNAHTALHAQMFFNVFLLFFPFIERKPRFVALNFSSHNLPTDRARELFKPSKEAEGLLRSIFKNPGTFWFELFWCDITTRGFWDFWTT